MAQRERDELQRELTRIRDQKSLMNMKQSALGGGAAGGADSSASRVKSAKGGYQLWHILSVAVISLLIGALLR